ncbi:MAG: DUF3810 domain-containing protein [Oscillospiraceae bacterium]|jgi:hypothetical protein|nr:DUF3810 domain-containing protein [Oscillospiraceae bacterium]
MKRRFLQLIPPAALIAAFYILCRNTRVMDFAARRVGGAWRLLLGTITGYLPLSLYEVGGTALALAIIALLVLAIIALLRRRNRAAAFGRIVALLVVAAYGFSAFLWFWCSAYFAPPVYYGALDGRGVTVEELERAAVILRDGANALAPALPRDADGHLILDLDEVIADSRDVFDGLTIEFPRLSGSRAKPKKMLYSEVMKRTGFTGVYFALTGEANISKNSPPAMLPVTVAHELAHSRGVAAEDAANFFGVAACLTSGLPLFEYSGYLDGLIYTVNALGRVHETYNFTSGYSELVRRDLNDVRDYWARVDEQNANSPVVAAMAEVVNDTYDGYLRANNQESGMATYGECVDLLVEWLCRKY